MPPTAAPCWSPKWEISEEELARTVQKISSANKAPGSNGIPGRAWVLALKVLGPRLLRLFDACLQEGSFPGLWKRARLVLLQKQGKPVDSPSAYRPLCLLDEMGKIFERILSARLVKHLSAVSSDLNERQFVSGWSAPHSTPSRWWGSARKKWSPGVGELWQ